MGAELGATTSIFPSDERTKHYLKAQRREHDWVELYADDDAEYADTLEINLDSIEPMIAKPHSPDNVVPLKELSGIKIDQVCIGSCTNSSYQLMRSVASILKGNSIAEGVSLLINPGSKQVYEMLSREGLMADMISAGARPLESSCGPCIGMGGSPGTGQISIRSYNRNFKGRSGNKEAFVYLASPVSCAAIAIKGKILDPRESDLHVEEFEEPTNYLINDNLLIPPKKEAKTIKVIKGPNIKDVPVKEPLPEKIEAEVLIKLSDNITTDEIMPAGASILPLRSNIPAMSEFVFSSLDNTFSKRAREAKPRGGGIIVGGENYGQGSSREHAAIAPMYLGIHAVIAKSYARIHRSNLINFGILPLKFSKSLDYDRIDRCDRLVLQDIERSLKGKQSYNVHNLTKNYSFEVFSDFNDREKQILLAGGLLPFTKKGSSSI
jgi:aconitate hydratase